jgi:tRNA threonylcarbamoyladenosine biosynthesis protein TsaB
MYILVFETTGKHASVACIDEAGNITFKKSENALSHLQSLMPMSELLMSECQLTIDDISSVAVSAGPGSFTGIRIGVATARAIAQAKGISCISVPTLESFVYNVEGFRGVVCPVFDARQSQIYAGGFNLKSLLPRGLPFMKEEKHDDSLYTQEVVPGGAYGISEFLMKLHSKIGDFGFSEAMFFGDGIELYRDEIEKWQQSSLTGDIQISFAPEDKREQTSSSVAKLALKLYNEGKQISYQDLKPIYMRKAEAERKLEENQGGKLTSTVGLYE